MLAVAVAAVLGTGIALWLFNSGKSLAERVADVALIILAQVIVLLAGVVVALQSSPTVLVWMADHFEVVSPMEIRRDGLALAVSEQVQMAWRGVRLQSLVLPSDAQARQSLLMAELGGQSLAVRQELWRDHQAGDTVASIRALPTSGGSQGMAGRDALLATSVCAAMDVGWLPLKSPHGFHTALVSRKDGRICDVLDLDLWDK
ncbi:MAG: hypothetical protein ACOYNB_02445 [Aquabacterium sp.]|uniref:hypothetical protein n=1 Tax=Aquabacterium sp. TaxID=1872578 RepID=UPI003BCB662D